MSVATKTKTNPPILFDDKIYAPTYFQFHTYYCLILRDRKNQLAFFTEQYIKKLQKNNIIPVN